MGALGASGHRFESGYPDDGGDLSSNLIGKFIFRSLMVEYHLGYKVGLKNPNNEASNHAYSPDFYQEEIVPSYWSCSKHGVCGGLKNRRWWLDTTQFHEGK